MTTMTNDETQNVGSDLTRTQVIGIMGAILLIACLTIAGYLHSENMFSFPYYQDTEGTNLANAWAWTETGDFSPYTYSYQEAPTGTFILGFWALLNGTLNNFGFPLNSGRVLMLFFHLISCGFIFGITKSLSKSNAAAVIAVMIFAFSPLATSIQRRVLLDNVMLPALLGSIYFVVGQQRNLYHYLISALLFGVAVLIRGSAIYLLPGFLIANHTLAHPHHKRFAINMWMTLTVCLLSIFPLYAQMRQELFPEGWFLGGDFPHVSLIEVIIDRGPDTGFFLNIGSGFQYSFTQWTDIGNLTSDPIIVYGGIISIIIVALLSQYNKHLRAIVILAFSYFIGLILGGRVVISDVLPLLPFFAISIGICIAMAAKLASIGGWMSKTILSLVTMLILLYPFYIFYTDRVQMYTMDQVQGQVEAVEWVQNNLDEADYVVTDNYAFVALRDTMPNIHHYWTVDTDPDIKFTLLGDNHCNIDYVLTTPQVTDDISAYNLDLMRRTLERSELLLTYENNGWPVQIWQVSKETCDVLGDNDTEAEEPTTNEEEPETSQ